MPEVVAAGISTTATPPSNGMNVPFEIFSRTSGQKEELRLNFVSPGYFSALRIPMLQGRLWDEQEIMRAAHLAAINQTMARQYWPQVDALEKQILFPDLKSQPPFTQSAKDSNDWMHIIGELADAR